jgi:hypothetical protein
MNKTLLLSIASALCFLMATGAYALPINDDCGSVTPQSLVAGIPIVFTGDNTDATNDCSMLGANEVWMAFVITECMDITINACGTVPVQTNLQTRLVANCPCGNEYSASSFNFSDCADGNWTLKYLQLAAGTYFYPYVSNQGQSGPYTITVSGTACLLPPANDSCSHANDGGILQPNSPIQFTGTTIGATHDCMMNSLPEVWVKFTTQACMDITIDYCGTTPAFNGMMASAQIFNSCPCGGSFYSSQGQMCMDFNTKINWQGVPAGTYYYPVLSGSGMLGNYIVNVTGAECPPPAQVDSAITAPVTVAGNTCGAINNCQGDAGEDYIYAVTIPTDGEWVFSLCNSSSNWNSKMLLDSVLCGSGIISDDDGCGTFGGLSRFLASLPAGTYYLTIDGVSATDCGQYTLDITPFESPCEGSNYSSGNFDGQGAVLDYRGLDYSSYGADDFSLTEAMILDSIKFTCSSDGGFLFSDSGDYQIMAVSDSAPGAVLFEGTNVPCYRVATGQNFQGNPVYAYQFNNLGIALNAGSYYLLCVPVEAEGGYGASNWLTAAPSGFPAYSKDTYTPDWTPIRQMMMTDANLSFCLFAHTQSGCSYMPGDINGDGQRIGGDVTFGVRYFKGTGGVPPDSCYMDSTSAYLYVAGDVNGNCEFRGSDITRLVAFFKGTAQLSHCHFFPPPILRNDKAIAPKLSGEN